MNPSQPVFAEKGRGPIKGLGRNVVVLGVVSLLTDISSEMIYPIIPLFLTGVLHAPMSVVGLIEGIAESTASLLKLVSGWWSDRVGRHRRFVATGYGLSAFSKPLLALAQAWPLVLVARFIDRTGKGLRTSPRDVMIAADCDPESRGKAFGLHRAMDTTGAVIGPLIAAACLTFFGFEYRTMFVLAFIPAVLGVLAITFTRSPVVAAAAPKGGIEKAKGRTPLSPAMKRFVLLYAIFALGNSSDVFLLLRVKDMGFSAGAVMLVYVFYNAVYALAAIPAGWLSDKVGRRAILAGGLAVFSVVYLGFAFFLNSTSAWLLFALYGFYGAATEGVAKAMVTDVSEPSNRGTAMGLFHAATGAMAFVASVVAGLLWSKVGPAAPFLYGAVCALVCAMLLIVTGPEVKEEKR